MSKMKQAKLSLEKNNQLLQKKICILLEKKYNKDHKIPIRYMEYYLDYYNPSLQVLMFHLLILLQLTKPKIMNIKLRDWPMSYVVMFYKRIQILRY